MKPILFSTPMVKAILEGRKSQTRRVVKPQPEGLPMYCYAGSHKADIGKWHHGDKRYTPPYHGDDLLYVRETWADLRGMGFGNDPRTDKPWNFAYKADIKPGSESDRARIDFGVKWRPSIHMPKEAARLFLVVKDVRVERLQDISEEDALAEGCDQPDWPRFVKIHGERKDLFNAKEAFEYLWDSINGKKYLWASNPWVWVVSFERTMKPEASQ